MSESRKRLRYGPFRLAPVALRLFFLLPPVALSVLLLGLHETTVRCQRDQTGVSCTMRESPSGVGGNPFTPVSVRSTREVVRSRGQPHAKGRLIVRDTQGCCHESLLVDYDDSAAVASELQRFLGDRTEAHFDQSLAGSRIGIALGLLFSALTVLALGLAIPRSGSIELRLSLDGERLSVKRKYCGLTFSRDEPAVAGATAVEIQWFREELPKQNGVGDLLARLCVATPCGNVFIPADYARGHRVHLRGAAELRELLSLAPMHDQLFEPELAWPEPGLADRVGSVALGMLVGAAQGLCLVFSLTLLLGPHPLPTQLSPAWLIAVGAALGGFIAPKWSSRRLVD